jgi:predicted dehydrogenase
MKTYRVALLGCRSRGTSQARAITKHPRTELVGICDLLPERLTAVGEQFGVPPEARYSDFQEMIRQTKPDIVNIPTATKFHAPLAEAVLKMGCHVDVEKPLTLTLSELDSVLAAQRASGKHLLAHNQSAVGPVESKLRRLVKEGFIGPIRTVRVRDKGYYGGYGILHQGCHAIALIASIVGPPTAVSAHMLTAGRRTTVDDIFVGPSGYGLVAGEDITCLYDMAGATYFINEDHWRPVVDSATDRVEFVGIEGALALDYADSGRVKLYHSPTPNWRPAGENWSEIPLTEAESSIEGLGLLDAEKRGDDIWLVDEWVRALDEGREPAINARVGADTMEMIHGAWASHAEGRRIDLPQANREHPLERWLKREGRPIPTEAPATYAEWLPWAQARAAAHSTNGASHAAPVAVPA